MRAVPLVIAALACLAGPVRAGDRLDVNQLAARSVGAVLAEVELERGKRPVQIRIVEVLGGRSDLTPTPGWANACVGGAKYYRQYLHQNAKWPENRYWRKALQRRKYRAVLFIAPDHYTKELAPSCEVERMLMEHTSLHPGFEAYVQKARTAMQAKAASTPGK